MEHGVRKFTDQTGQTIELKHIPAKIISLVPSQTELLYELGLDAEVAGITRFCIRPREWFQTKTRIGGTKTVNIEKVKTLKPDLIIANKEENIKEQVEALKTICPVWISDVANLGDATRMIAEIGCMTGKSSNAENLIYRIKAGFEKLKSNVQLPAGKNLNVLYLVWKKPWMAAGTHTFINDMLERCGFVNAFSHKARYPHLDKEEIMQMNPKFIFLSSEPFPFREKHLKEIRAMFPHSVPVLVNGEYFSWYGSRLADAPGYFEELLSSLHHQWL